MTLEEDRRSGPQPRRAPVSRRSSELVIGQYALSLLACSLDTAKPCTARNRFCLIALARQGYVEPLHG